MGKYLLRMLQVEIEELRMRKVEFRANAQTNGKNCSNAHALYIYLLDNLKI